MREAGGLNSPLVWDLMRNVLDRTYGLYRHRMDVIREWGVLGENSTLLDVGCGTGHYARIAPGRYVGIDIDERYIRHARKKYIAFQYLIPRQIEENGITKEQIEFPEEAVSHIIRHYTREAGVRNLERTIGTICRKQARRLAEGKTEKLVVTNETVQEFLGGIKVRSEGEIAERTKRAGVVVGLAWTPSGGDVLFVEANQMKGKGGLTITGQIQDVMRESMQAGLSWVRSNAKQLGIDEEFFANHDIHIHVPAGAIPKDGPSAGVTIVTALVSLLSGKQVRPLLAMTGEITLSGNVLPVGGIKEKVLAAKRAGVHDVI